MVSFRRKQLADVDISKFLFTDSQSEGECKEEKWSVLSQE
jgi:hypothetical protein